MSDFKAKMHQIRFRLGLHPRARWRSLHRSPRLPSWIQRGLLLRGGKRGEGDGSGGKEDGREWDVGPGGARAPALPKDGPVIMIRCSKSAQTSNVSGASSRFCCYGNHAAGSKPI